MKAHSRERKGEHETGQLGGTHHGTIAAREARCQRADPKEFDRQLALLETYLKDRPTDQDARLWLAANYLFGMRPAAAVDLLESTAGESLRATSSGLALLEAARKQQYSAAAASLLAK